MNAKPSEPTKEGLTTFVEGLFRELEIKGTLDATDGLNIMCEVDDRYFEPKLGGKKHPNVNPDQIVKLQTPEKIADLYMTAYEETLRHPYRVERMEEGADKEVHF